MDTYVPHRVIDSVTGTLSEFSTLQTQALDTVRRVRQNVQNMPLTSFALAIVVGVALGTMMTTTSYRLHLRH